MEAAPISSKKKKKGSDNFQTTYVDGQTAQGKFEDAKICGWFKRWSCWKESQDVRGCYEWKQDNYIVVENEAECEGRGSKKRGDSTTSEQELAGPEDDKTGTQIQDQAGNWYTMVDSKYAEYHLVEQFKGVSAPKVSFTYRRTDPDTSVDFESADFQAGYFTWDKDTKSAKQGFDPKIGETKMTNLFEGLTDKGQTFVSDGWKESHEYVLVIHRVSTADLNKASETTGYSPQKLTASESEDNGNANANANAKDEVKILLHAEVRCIQFKKAGYKWFTKNPDPVCEPLGLAAQHAIAKFAIEPKYKSLHKILNTAKYCKEQSDEKRLPKQKKAQWTNLDNNTHNGADQAKGEDSTSSADHKPRLTAAEIKENGIAENGTLGAGNRVESTTTTHHIRFA